MLFYSYFKTVVGKEVRPNNSGSLFSLFTAAIELLVSNSSS
jgi:hypothetical protein